MALRRNLCLERRYIFEYDVGQWTFGTVQVLKERETGSLKTCKVVKKSILRFTSDVLPRLKALAELKHPHLCSITDVLEDKEAYYIVTDFLQGGDVGDWMERLEEGSWLQEATCAAYIRQAVLALAHSHAAQVYHRDLRPSSLLLTSKLPDAVVKVTDFGLAAILDPDNAIVQSQPCAYTMPEILQSSEQHRGAADIWSVGAIAHALLVGEAPSEGSKNPGWSLSRQLVVADDEAWSERSSWSCDFTRRCLRQSGERPTSAKLLWHPWLRTLQPLSGSSFQADNDAARDLRHKTLCYLLSVILVPVVVPHMDFDKLRTLFQEADSDKDGLVTRAVGQRLLLQRRNLAEAVAPALSIVDVCRTDSVDLCALASADLIVRDFFASGPTHAPLCGPFRATDLVGKMMEFFFRTFSEKRNGTPTNVVSAASVRSKLRTATARDLELYAEVRYDDLLDCLPEEQPIDAQTLTSSLSASECCGTPLGVSGEMSPIKAHVPWSLADNPLAFSMSSILQSCGLGAKRDDSPHSIRIH